MIYVERLNITHPKPKRFPVGKIVKEKDFLTPREVQHLLLGKVVIEEKMDGKPLRFISGDPQLFIFAEDLKRMHSIFYHVPGRYAIFDIFYASRDVFVCPDEKLALAREIRAGKIRLASANPLLFFPVPRIATGRFGVDDFPQFLGKSAYARVENNVHVPAPGEGIVVKSAADAFPEEFYTGKIVRAEFLGVDTINYLKRPYRGNAIDPAVEIVESIPG
jgi:hypothetical protein